MLWPHALSQCSMLVQGWGYVSTFTGIARQNTFAPDFPSNISKINTKKCQCRTDISRWGVSQTTQSKLHLLCFFRKLHPLFLPLSLPPLLLCSFAPSLHRSVEPTLPENQQLCLLQQRATTALTSCRLSLNYVQHKIYLKVMLSPHMPAQKKFKLL